MTNQADDPDKELPKLELFIKIMKMTLADNDHQALVALRKANKLLGENAWDWERLLRGKIKIVEDPFNAIARPAAAPVAKPANVKAPQPQPASYAAKPFGGMAPPKPAPRPYTPPPPPPPPKVAPPGPPTFASHGGDWVISSSSALVADALVVLHKSDGSTKQVTVGSYIRQTPAGYHLYKIGGSKWQRKYTSAINSVNDL